MDSKFSCKFFKWKAIFLTTSTVLVLLAEYAANDVFVMENCAF